jgi:hypothetical protein
MKYLFVITVLFTFSLTFTLTFGTVYATHNPELEWMNPYKDENGYSCCGIYDCVEVQAKVLEQGIGYVIVIVDGVRMKLPQGKGKFIGKTHFHSNDNTDYWCFGEKYNRARSGKFSVGGRAAPVITPKNTRCVFISFGG